MSEEVKIPEDIKQFVIDISEVNKYIMSLDVSERRRFTKDIKTVIAMLLVSMKQSGKQIPIDKLAHMIRLGFDREYALEYTRLVLQPVDTKPKTPVPEKKPERKETITKTILVTIPSRITIYDRGIMIVTKSGLEIWIPLAIVSPLIQKYGSALRLIKGLTALEIEKQLTTRGREQLYTLVARRIKPLVSEAKVEKIQELYQKYIPIELKLWLLGIVPNEKTIKITLPKLLFWYIVENEPIHCAIFEPPETGKTHLSLIASVVVNYYYTTEPPSKAFFVYDARQKTTESIVSMYDGIIIDEAEKTMEKYPQDWEEFISTCMTGMEQGKWVRSRGHGATIEKMFTVVLSGNILEREQVSLFETTELTDTRTMLMAMVRQLVKKVNPVGLASRLTYVTYRKQVDPITQYLTLQTAPTPVLRGLVYLIQNDIDKEAPKLKPLVAKLIKEKTGKTVSYESRVFRHVYKIFTVLKTLFRIDDSQLLYEATAQIVKIGDIDEEIVKEMIQKTKGETFEESKMQEVTESKEETVKESDLLT